MRYTLLIAFFLSFCALGACPSHADEFSDMVKGDKGAAPADSKAGAGAADADEFHGGAAGGSETGNGEDDPDKPPPLDEYKNIPINMMIPAESPTANTDNGEQGSEIHASAGGKLTYENLMRLYQQGKFDQVVPGLEPLAKGGHHPAQELMGIMYRMGQGVAKDPQKAYQYLSQAADANKPLAQYHLAIMYYSGEGVSSDPIMALMWIQIAIVHFSEGPEKERAKQDRDVMYARLTRREKDRAVQLAHDWLAKKGEAHLLDLESGF